ncbi:DUF72 domain-containing protein [Fictibacillus sp. WQ 8-8]|uniref:DUF72 domain-containing protein n=1 Tax=unclassified Fictibacillus TaxID=2644029 RepID=UPI00210B1DF1|nr:MULTISPECIES: DUF72 domain-containing protein [unclassified Fictibacillus]MCQ6267969.1 DUF72 domain-containing protein [Fictibacillus sp. WQ 8-8]MED2971202.1 DUF72 domain-containing protein [Fictibacillus sp. B-59209]
MILIGVTGWGDHQSLYPEGTKSTEKLKLYSGFFPVVEVDSSFYAIQPLKNYQKWIKDTPDRFSFIIKAYQGMTGHSRGKIPFESTKEMFDLFKASIQPVIESGKMKAVLFQYPPWFECNKESVQMLRFTREMMEGIPVALEFRHQSWFMPEMREKTVEFMREERWIHTICDEPQAGQGSVPAVIEPTSSALTIIRMHGRNVHGWNNHGQENWREVRYLYRYNDKELAEWKQHVEKLSEQSKEIVILFNNNSGGDAADNARKFIDMLSLDYEGLSPRQLDLF